MTLPLTHQIVKYGTIVFIVGLASLFVFCTWAIYQMSSPLRQFAESAVNIADGNLDTPLPKIHSEDELLQLRNAFEYMQTSLKQHVNVFADGTVQGDDLTLLFLRHGSSCKNNSTAPRRIIMKNEMSEVSRMRGFFLSVCREHDIDEDTFKTLNLAIEEWVANVINYAYPKGIRGHVELTAKVSEGILTLVIKDHGTPFDPTQHIDVDVDAALDKRQIGGLGIHLVKAIMDTMHYERSADGYNVLTLTKQIKGELKG